MLTGSVYQTVVYSFGRLHWFRLGQVTLEDLLCTFEGTDTMADLFVLQVG